MERMKDFIKKRAKRHGDLLDEAIVAYDKKPCHKTWLNLSDATDISERFLRKWRKVLA